MLKRAGSIKGGRLSSLPRPWRWPGLNLGLGPGTKSIQHSLERSRGLSLRIMNDYEAKAAEWTSVVTDATPACSSDDPPTGDRSEYVQG
jgi:hypothetical protein